MSSLGLEWTLYVPLIGGLLAALIAWGRQTRAVSRGGAPLLRLLALVIACATVLLEAGLLSIVPDGRTTTLFGVAFAISAPARYVLTAANVALLCALIYGWLTADEDQEQQEQAGGDPWRIAVVCSISTLLAGAALSTDRLASALLLFAAALPVAACVFVLVGNIPVAPADPPLTSDDARAEFIANEQATARKLAGAFKQLALALLATVLWIAGATLLDRYGFNLENTGLLQFGVALLAVGLLVRAGSMPFSAGHADSLETTPSWAILLLGAIAPVSLVAGLLMLAPIEGDLARGAAAGWLGAVGALLAGVRALGALRKPTPRPDAQPEAEKIAAIAIIKAMTVALAVSWAVYGLLSGSQMGAVGAVLLATNIALAVPLLVLGGRWIALIGAASMLGLPPFGGFTGAILVAGSAANAGGLWLALLLLGSALVAAAWLSTIFKPEAKEPDTQTARRNRLTDPILLLALVLIIAQLALFLLSNNRLTPLLDWATIPWITAP
jgi:formate hydrogenlyase subunit 3/multisubunit Na+/H+ antiporter MnhD subunit